MNFVNYLFGEHVVFLFGNHRVVSDAGILEYCIQCRNFISSCGNIDEDQPGNISQFLTSGLGDWILAVGGHPT